MGERQAATLALLIGLIALAADARAQDQPPPVVITSGSAIVQRTPDVAFISLAVEAHARSPREAQQQNAVAMTAVAKRLTELGIAADARKTTGLRLEQEFDTANGRRTPKGFFARNTLDVRVDEVTRVGEVADAVVAAGATAVDGIRFDLKDRPAAEREAIRLAVADARARAEAAAAGAGRTLDRIVKIEEGERTGPPRPMMTMARMEASTVVDAGSIDVRATVTLTASLK